MTDDEQRRYTDLLVQSLQAEIDRRFAQTEQMAVERDRRYEQRYTIAAAANDAAHTAARTAVDKAEAATDKRFEGVNEFRAQLSDQAATFIRREVAEASIAELRHQIDTNRAAIDSNRGEQKGAGELRATLTGLVVVVVGLAAVISPHIH